MAKAFQALRACNDTLIRDWGLDPKVQQDLSRMVQPVDLEWARQVQMAYPIALAAKGRHARAHLRLLVNSEGVPTACNASQAFANTEFKVNACDIVMKNAHFHPALNKAGQPVASYFTTTIIYFR